MAGSTETRPEPLVVERVGGPFGVRGWVHVTSFLEPPEALLAIDGWWLRTARSEWQRRAVVEAREHGRGLVARFADSSDRDEAALMRGAAIGAEPGDLPAAEPGEYYWNDLIGTRVVTEDGVELGHVESMMETGANDVMVVCGERERLVPFAMDDVVLEVDLEARLIRVDWHPED